MGLFVADSIKLGRASVALGIVQERSCSSTGYLYVLPREAVNIIGHSIIIIIGWVIIRGIFILTIGCIRVVVRGKLLGNVPMGNS